MSKRDEYVQKLKATLDEWNQRLDRLEERFSNMSAEARIEAERQLETLHEYRMDARARLHEVQESTEQAWEHLRKGVDKAIADLGEAFEKVRATLE